MINVFSQTEKLTIEKKLEIHLRLNDKISYTIQYETEKFILYFNKNKVLKIISDSLNKNDSIRFRLEKLFSESKNSEYKFVDVNWFLISNNLMMDTLYSDDRIRKDTFLQTSNDFTNILSRLLFSGNLKIFEKKTNQYLLSKSIYWQKENYISDNYQSYEEKFVTENNDIIFIANGEYFESMPPFEMTEESEENYDSTNGTDRRIDTLNY
jgi:hypothetical protein